MGRGRVPNEITGQGFHAGQVLNHWDLDRLWVTVLVRDVGFVVINVSTFHFNVMMMMMNQRMRIVIVFDVCGD